MHVDETFLLCKIEKRFKVAKIATLGVLVHTQPVCMFLQFSVIHCMLVLLAFVRTAIISKGSKAKVLHPFAFKGQPSLFWKVTCVPFYL